MSESIYKFQPLSLERKSHNFEYCLHIPATNSNKVIVRFNTKLTNNHNLNEVYDCRLSLFFFDSSKIANSPVLIKDSFFRQSFNANAIENLIAFELDIPEDISDITVFAYTDRMIPFAWELSNFEVISGLDYLKIQLRDNQQQVLRQELDLSKKWKVEDGKVYVEWLSQEFYMDVDDDFSLDGLNKQTIEVIEELLFGKLEFELFGVPRLLTNPKLRLAKEQLEGNFELDSTILCFSTGEDSTAARALLGDTVTSVYSRRPYRYYSTPKGDSIDLGSDINEMKSLESVDGTRIYSNTFEKIGLSVAQRHGFRDSYGYAAVALLASSGKNFNVIAFGSVMEQVYMRSGNNFVDIIDFKSSMVNRYLDLFAYAGFWFALPTGFLSEVLTNKICEHYSNKFKAVPCPNTDLKGNACGVCFKCFRKTRLSGVGIEPISESVAKTISKRPLKSATSLIYSMQKSCTTSESVSEYLSCDLSFLERYFQYGCHKLLPKALIEQVESVLDTLEILPMSIEDEFRLREVAKIFDPENYNDSRAFPCGKEHYKSK